MRRIGVTLLAGAALVSADRIITLRNNCAQNVYFQLTAGAAQNVNGTGPHCNTNADCIQGSSCASNHLCFWNIPPSVAAGGGYRLAHGESRIMSMPYLPQTDIVWSGNIGGCLEGKGCSSQDFGNCKVNGCGSSGAVNLAEFTLSKTGTDFYDVSIINGINLPMKMTPSITANGDYQCKAAGDMVDANTWTFNPPSNDYIWVSLENPLHQCSKDSDCSNGFVCGVSRNPAGNIFVKSCGTKLGYWTADQICGMNAGMGAPWNCQQSSGGRFKMINYLLCDAGISSCYQNGAPNDCCGCANWWQIGVPAVPAHSSPCLNSSPFWTANVLPTLMFLKKGCPGCYTYPYDDMTSTFVCSNAHPGVYNSVTYDVTFCPAFAHPEIA